MKIYILLNLFLLISYIYILYKAKHSCHMLQLESYRNERYLKWMKNNKKRVIKIKELILILISAILFFNFEIGIIINIVYLFLLFIFRNKYNEKKPLVITPRIKRIFFTLIILFIIEGILLNIFKSIYLIILLNIIIYWLHYN